MTIERPGVAYDLRGGALGLRPGAGGEENSGVDKNHQDFRYAVYHLLRVDVRERGRLQLRGRLQNVANFYGVMKVAYNNNNTILGLSPQQGEDNT